MLGAYLFFLDSWSEMSLAHLFLSLVALRDKTIITKYIIKVSVALLDFLINTRYATAKGQCDTIIQLIKQFFFNYVK